MCGGVLTGYVHLLNVSAPSYLIAALNYWHAAVLCHRVLDHGVCESVCVCVCVCVVPEFALEAGGIAEP